MPDPICQTSHRADFAAHLKSCPRLSLRMYESPDLVKSRFPFRYERMDHPSLVALRQEYRLDRVVAGGDTEFDRMVLLRSWVAGRWKHGTPRASRHASLKAIEILGLAAKGERFFCHHDATTYLQCCLAMGWQTRYVGVRTSGVSGHSVTEVWSNQYRKWILMDVSYDLHYLRHATPLNALELHNIWMDPSTVPRTETRFVHGRSGPNLDSLDALNAFKLLDFYYIFGVSMGNDLSRHRGHENVWIDKPFLQLNDPRLSGPRYRPFPICRFTSRPVNLYWTINTTHIGLAARPREDTLRVRLTSVTPGFMHYQVRMDEGVWGTQAERFAWQLHPGVNTLEVKAVNICGVEGPVSRLSISSR